MNSLSDIPEYIAVAASSINLKTPCQVIVYYNREPFWVILERASCTCARPTVARRFYFHVLPDKKYSRHRSIYLYVDLLVGIITQKSVFTKLYQTIRNISTQYKIKAIIA
ncbi:hypothetical protein CEXT_376441 [Caerostris extrusa]|uniref:Uncharacterized protein n=1 Tax=Caerostris extrusa TaxID=172846 RepID=A0AAV4NWW5_CAEEX|nr:hypothetical protein CEXT_376441 [Caerostris extrusa]